MTQYYGQTTAAVIPSALTEYYDRVLIEPAKSALVHGLFAQKKSIKAGVDTIKMRKYPLLAKSTTALVEGVNPTPYRLSKDDITAQLATYGAYVEITDEVSLYNEDPILTIAQERTGRQAGESLDEITKNVLVAGSNYMRANGVTNRTDIVAKLTATDLKKIHRAMQNLNAPYFKDMIKAGAGVGTKPIRPSYFVITHPDVVYDLENILTTSWVPVNEYSNAEAAHEFEVGSYLNFRFLATTEAKIWVAGGGSTGSTGCKDSTSAGNLDVYSMIFLSPDAYGTVDIDGGLKSIIKSKEEIGGPLERYATAGWTAKFAAKIIDDSRMYRYECAVSA